MTITPNKTSDKLTLSLGGRLDTTTSPELEKAITEQCGDVTALEIDMAKLDYISSAGLRVLLAAKKSMDAANGTLTVTHVCDEIREVFDMTGFMDILDIQ